MAEFLNFMKEVEIEYSTALSMMKKCENLECDYASVRNWKIKCFGEK